ncbi:transglycosylase SLT domain-containing protein [Roseibium aggregatum]|uniref:transglycosylase SLT domain-containing protein n=2 Tax=Roseibium aggregatum TaxID=187304 RepID=UPI00094ADA9C|nr:transporter substrate-binding domain-containing protein [Roseibium aggregatum]UFI02263.1 transporter substrate-binding domain-containing protein [Roseibium aggregatum]
MIPIRHFLPHLLNLMFSMALVVAGLASQSTLASAMGTGLAETLENKLLEPFDGDFDALLKRGYIRVLIPFSKTGYFIDKGVQRGSSVDLMTEFDKYLNKIHEKKAKDAKLVLVPTLRDHLFSDLAAGKGDIAIGNLTITREREDLVAFSSPLLKDVHEVPVTAAGVADLPSPEALSGQTVHVRASSSYYQSLKALNDRLGQKGAKPVDIVTADEHMEDEDLLEMVSAGAIYMVIVDQHKAELWLEVLDGLKMHPSAAVRTDGEIAIAVRNNAPELLKEVDAFAATVTKGTLLGNIILKRYLKEADYLRDMRSADYKNDLASLQTIFQKYGDEYEIDWLLIAAQSFQESRFDQKAHSRAGAVGLMQIKPATAKGDPINISGIDADPDKNVQAGVKYLRYLANQYFAGLQTRDANQTFFALAAYNAGPSRFAKLREKAKQQGFDPDKWFDNVEWIVASEIGREPVDYVGNIYQYYVVFFNEQQRRQTEAAEKAAAGN